MQPICVVEVGEICSEKGPGGGGAIKGRGAEGSSLGGLLLGAGQPAVPACDPGRVLPLA